MKNRLVFVVCLCLCLLLAGCNSSPTVEVMDVVIAPSIAVNALDGRVTQFMKPFDMLWHNDHLWVVDYAQNAILILDADGNFIEKLGHLGSAPGEFIHPTAVAYKNERFYIMDSGNHRIQIMDPDFVYISEVSLPKLEDGSYFRSIAVSDSGDIFAASSSIMTKYASVYWGSNDDSVSQTVPFKRPFHGRLLYADGQVLAYDVLECTKEGSNYVAFSGRSEITEMDITAAATQVTLPYGYTPACLSMGNDRLYAISMRWERLDAFDLDGRYIETLCTFTRIDRKSYESFSICISPAGVLYVCDATDGKLYILRDGR